MRKKILKLSIPELDKSATLQQYLDVTNPLLHKWEIHLNNPKLEFADAWCIIENTNIYDSKCYVNSKNIYFFSAETAQNLGHIEESIPMKYFLGQFENVYTYHQFLNNKVKSEPPFLPWMINANHGTSIFQEHKRNVNFFQNFNSVNKSKLVSVVCSSQNLTPGHKLRLRFVEQLQSHFGTDLDWYGNGVNTVSEKWEALAPYKYTIALENQSRHNVLTEKIGDSFLALSYPIYWGAPNVSKYFDEKGFSIINIEDFEGSVRIIEDLLYSNTYEERLPYIIENKDRVIHDFNFLNRILNVCESNSLVGGSMNLTLRSVNHFQPATHRIYNSIGGRIRSSLLEIDRRLGTNFLEIGIDLYILLRYNKLSKQITKSLQK